MRALVLIAGLCLAAGIVVLFGYCHGTAGFSLAYPLTAASIRVDVTASGVAAITGAGLVLLGCLALVLAWFGALFSRSPRPAREESEPRRRGGPFEG